MKWFIAKKKRCCKHEDLKHSKYLLKNGTPMIKTECRDCGDIIDEGHVYGDSEGWIEKKMEGGGE